MTYKEIRILFRFRQKKQPFPKMTGEARPQLPHMTSRHCKTVPEHRVHQQLYQNTRKNDIISLVRQCRTPPAVNALATGVSVTVYTILSMETAMPGVIVLFSLAPLGFLMQGENNDTTGLLWAEGPGKSAEELNLRKKVVNMTHPNSDSPFNIMLERLTSPTKMTL